MKKLRVGIIGTGMAFERLHYPAYQELSDQYGIVAVCDKDPGKAIYWAKQLHLAPENVYTDYRPLAKRNDLDVIDIMVPLGLNFKITEEVASLIAGTHKSIICEKPLAATTEEARAAREIPKKYNVPVMIAENYRYSEESNLIRDYVRGKRIGEVFYFLQNRVFNFPEDMTMNRFSSAEWRQHPDYPGGVILDAGVHDIAALRHIFGAIDKVQAFGFPQRYDFAPYTVLSANMLFKSGVVGYFSFFCGGKEMQRPLVGLRIFGDQGMIFLEERDCGTINIAYNDGKTEQIPYRPQRGFYNELLNFYQAAAGNEPVAVTPELEFGDTLTVLQILQSAQEKNILSVDREADFTPAYAAIPGDRPDYGRQRPGEAGYH